MSTSEAALGAGGLSNPDNYLDTESVPRSNQKVTVLSFKTKSGGKPILLDKSSDVSEQYKTALTEVFSKMFAYFSPDEIPSLKSVVSDLSAFDEWIVQLSVSPMEKVFLKFLFQEKRRQFKGMSIQECREVVHHHIVMHEQTVYDTVEKVEGGFSPWFSQLGFEHLHLMKAIDPTRTQVAEILDKGIVAQLNKYMCALFVSSDFLDLPVSQCDFRTFNKKEMLVTRRFPKDEKKSLERFMYLPWDDKGFCERIDSLQARELVYLKERFMLNYPSPKLLVRWITHALRTYHESVDADRLIAFNELYIAVSRQYAKYAKFDESFVELMKDLLITARSPGILKFAKDLFDSAEVDLPESESFYSFFAFLENSRAMPVDRWWVTVPEFADMILLNFCNTVGVEKGFEWMIKSKQENDTFSVQAWLWATENEEMADSIPMSWWSSMADD